MDHSELAIDEATLRAMVQQVLDTLAPWLAGQTSSPIGSGSGGARAARDVRRDWPEAGAGFAPALASMRRAIDGSLGAAHAGYMAYVPGGGLPHAAVADLFSDLTNRYTGFARPAQGCVALEVDVLRWLCTMVGYEADSGGIFTSGGSLANLSAVVAARHRYAPEDLRQAVVYCTEQTHHSVAKAVLVAGLPAHAVVHLPVDPSYRLDVGALARAILADRAAGRMPFLVVANAGSTAVGSVDDLAAVAAVARANDLWFHVDAAYGGFFALTQRGQALLGGLAQADSIALDPHKGLFLPYGTGCLIVKNLSSLRDAHKVQASYLPETLDDPLAWDFADLGPELSRPFRGLRVWLPLVMHGFAAFRTALDAKLDQARRAAEAIRALPGVTMVSEPVLSLFAFRLVREGDTAEAADHRNRRWLTAINQRRRVFLSGAIVLDPADGQPRFVLRVCVLSFRTQEATIDALIADATETLF